MLEYKGFIIYNKEYTKTIDEFYTMLNDYNNTSIENVFKPNDNDLENIVSYLSSNTYDNIVKELDDMLDNFENKEGLINFGEDSYRLDSNNYSKNLVSYKIFCYFCSTCSELFDTNFNNIIDNEILLENIIKYSWLIKNFINFKYRLYPNLVLNLLINIGKTNRFDLLLVFCELCPDMVKSGYKPKIVVNIKESVYLSENPRFRLTYESFKHIILSS